MYWFFVHANVKRKNTFSQCYTESFLFHFCSSQILEGMKLTSSPHHSYLGDKYPHPPAIVVQGSGIRILWINDVSNHARYQPRLNLQTNSWSCCRRTGTQCCKLQAKSRHRQMAPVCRLLLYQMSKIMMKITKQSDRHQVSPQASEAVTVKPWIPFRIYCLSSIYHFN